MTKKVAPLDVTPPHLDQLQQQTSPQPHQPHQPSDASGSRPSNANGQTNPSSNVRSSNAFVQKPNAPNKLIRRGSKKLMEIFEGKSNGTEMQLDLDTFYQNRLRRKTFLEKEIETNLLTGGNALTAVTNALATTASTPNAALASAGPMGGGGAIPTAPVAPIMDDYMTGPAQLRGLRVTLSPGEEYENYQKVNHARQLQEAAAAAIQDEDATEFEDVVATGPDNKKPKHDVIHEEHHHDQSEDERTQSHRLSGPTTSTAFPASLSGLNGIGSSRSLATNASALNAQSKRSHGKMSARTAATIIRSQLSRSRVVKTQEQLLKKSPRILHPHSRLRLMWDITSIVFIFYNAVTLPFQASFNAFTEEDDNFFDRFLDIFFLLDILLTLNTGVEIDGSLRFNRKTIIIVYLKSWFIVDLVAALPYAYMLPSHIDLSNESTKTLVRSLKLLRLVRLLRLFRISRIFRRIQNTIFIRSTLSSLLKYLLLVMFMAHWFSCTFHAIAVANEDTMNWVHEQKLDTINSTKWDRYVAALYFSVMTLYVLPLQYNIDTDVVLVICSATIGYGDVSGTNADERLFSIFAMIIGGGCFAYGITNIVELVSSLTVQETRFREKMDEVNEYMKARELPMKLRMEIREFYHNTRQSRDSKLNAEHQILNDLSSKLRSKVALSINDQFLRKFPFFAGSDPNFLLELALNMRMIHFAPLEDVIIEGEIGHEMFFIFRGAVEVLKGGKQIGILGENQYFGEMAILSADNRRTATVRTLCFCELRMLSRNRFLDALALFPAMQSKMAQVAKVRAAPMPTLAGLVAAATAEHLLLKNSRQQQPQQSSSPPPHQLQASRKHSGTSSAAPSPIGAGNGGASSFLFGSRAVATATTTGTPSTMGMASASSGAYAQQRKTINNPVVAPVTRIQKAERRTSNPYIAAAGGRRRSSAQGTGVISSSMALSLSEASSMLDEAARKQELLINRVLKLQGEMGTLQPIHQL